MPRRFFNDGQEIVFEDFNAISSATQREFYDRILYNMLLQTENAFFGDGFLTTYSTSTSVSVAAGVGLQRDNAQVSPEPELRVLYRPDPVTVNIAAADLSNDRIDIVVVKAAIVTEISSTRKFKNATTSVITNETLPLQKDWEALVEVVTGTPAISPSVPATPSGYIKIAELYVTTATGMSGSGAVTDKRSLMPVGGDATIDTSAFVRLTQSAATPFSQLFSDIDGFIKHGYFEYHDTDALGAHPSAPASGKIRRYYKSGAPYSRANGGAIVQENGHISAAVSWNPPAGSAPVADEENDEKVYLFEAGATNKLVAWLKVPQTYVAGTQILMYIAHYSPSTSDTILLQTTSYLIRKNNDAVTSTANLQASGNSALTNTVANRYREVSLPITSSVGLINGVAVNPGDLIRVELARGSDTDTADIRFIPSATEVKFS